MGKATTVVAAMNARMWARENQNPTATTGPRCSRQRTTAAAIAPNVSWLSRITNTDASDRNQFSTDHINQTNTNNGTNSRKTRLGCGSASEKANPARIAAATTPSEVARINATRSRFSAISERIDECCFPVCGKRKRLASGTSSLRGVNQSSSAFSVAARPSDAATVQPNAKVKNNTIVAMTKRKALP